MESAHERHRHSGQLPFDQIGGGGQLIRLGDLGHAEFVAVGVDIADVATQGGHARDADGMVGQAGSPRPTGGVADDDGDLHAQARVQPGRQRPGACIRVDWQQSDLILDHIGCVHAGAGDDEPMPGLHDPGRPPPRHLADGFGLDGGQPGRLPVAVDAEQSAFRL